VSLTLPARTRCNKVTIIPRGRALGITAYLPEEELHKYTKQSIQARLAMAYGGRVAEELVFGPERSRPARPRTSSTRPTLRAAWSRSTA